jgi:hypothetical protein
MIFVMKSFSRDLFRAAPYSLILELHKDALFFFTKYRSRVNSAALANFITLITTVRVTLLVLVASITTIKPFSKQNVIFRGKTASLL